MIFQDQIQIHAFEKQSNKLNLNQSHDSFKLSALPNCIWSVGGGICFSKLIKNLAVLFPLFNSTQDQDQLELVCFTVSCLYNRSQRDGHLNRLLLILISNGK